MSDSTSQQRIAEVAAIEDAALRNLWITQTYHELALAMKPNMAGNATWLSFAVWASRTVGKTLREEEIPKWMREALADAEHFQDNLKAPRWMRALGLARFLDEHTPIGMMEQVLREMSRWLGVGNVLVFAELAPIYSQFAKRFPPDQPRDDNAFTTFLAESKIEGTEDERLAVHDAFMLYYASQYEKDKNLRAQMVLTANISAVLHEQKRLQPHITGSMDATIQVIARGLFLTSLGAFVHRTIGKLIPAIDRATRNISDEVLKVWEHTITKLMMSLETPNGPDLDLSDDVPALPGQHLFPGELSEIDFTPLQVALQTWDKTQGTGRGSAAADWRDLSDRMCFVVNLFRSRQLEESLLTPPFTPEQLAQLHEGIIPEGPL